MRRLAVIVAIVGIIGLGLALSRTLAPTSVPAVSSPRRCVDCHALPRDGPGGLHALLADCEGCHLGDPTAADADAAHRGMEREPGALDTAERTCGRGGCHPDHLSRVRGSLMATASGLIAVDRWAFGELAVPTSSQTALEVLAAAHPTVAQDHLRRLCLGCHLNTRKDNRDDMLAGTASGCSACHVAPRPTPQSAHPVIDRVPPDQRCFGCHSRSGRVSLSYQGWHEVRGEDLEACADPIELQDGRAVCETTDDVHHAAGLACVDCHLHTELMGDGAEYRHEEQQVEIRCESCHGPADKLETTWGQVRDASSRRLAALAKMKIVESDRVRTGRRGTPVWNLIEREGEWSLESKLGAGRFEVTQTPKDAQHDLRGHERLACATCHSAWIPRCPTCHTHYEPEGSQWDFGRAAVAPGVWREHAERYFADPPTLAQRGGRIVTAAPGMLGTLDARAAGGEQRQASWFAAFDPHTTVKQGRTCNSCHLNPVAMGLGSGRLELRPRPRFLPAGGGPANRANSDGWQDLFAAPSGAGTRLEVRGLSAQSQWRMLRVGACLGCHSSPKDSIFSDFSDALDRRRTRKARSCRGWDRPWLHELPAGSPTP